MADITKTEAIARAMRKTRLGRVVSDKMQKTIVVAIERRVAHPVYGKMVTHTKNFKAHDEENTAKAGDLVSTPPMVAHAQKFTEDSVFLSLTTREREEGKYEEDTVAYPVIEGYLNKELKTK